MLSTIDFRIIEDSDDSFLRQVYVHSRDREFQYSLWTAEQKSSFLDSQFNLQNHHYKVSNPGAASHIITLGGQNIGRLIVDRTGDDMKIMDLQILPAFRGQGIGTSILKALINEAATSNTSARLHVEHENIEAQKLYYRLGFRQMDTSGPYIEMQWKRPRSK